MTSLALTRADDLKAEALVVGTSTRAGRSSGVSLLAPPTSIKAANRRRLESVLADLGATGKSGDVVRLPGSAIGLDIPMVVAVGVGSSDLNGTKGSDALREAAATATRALAGSKRVIVALPIADAAALAAVAHGSALGAYQFTAFKSSKPEKPAVRTVAIAVSDPRNSDLKEALKSAQVLIEAITNTRDLINTPPSHLHPADIADVAVSLSEGLPIDIEILDEEALVAGGYGGIAGVGAGAADPPRLIRMAYRPRNASLHLALVGKGITFDTGGYSMKPPTSMLGMQADMSGAAAVINVTVAIARLGLPIAITTYAACAENMVSGTAQRPTDVITIYGGKTVEVNNTDAEGRLVMADALVRCGEDKPDIVIDVATLTGAMVLALGHRTAGFFTDDDELAASITDAADSAGEPFWRMPFLTHLRSSLDSQVADLANVGERMGGASVAALFLREFAPKGIRWAHLDIAGPAFNESGPYGVVGKGGAGFAVSTLVHLAESMAQSGRS
jgi:leucyl aminopeptidase